MVNVVVIGAKHIFPANEWVGEFAATRFEQQHSAHDPVAAQPEIPGEKFKPVLHEIRRAHLCALEAWQDLSHGNVAEYLATPSMTRIIERVCPL